MKINPTRIMHPAFPTEVKIVTIQDNLNPSSLKGGCNNPQTVLALVLKIAQPRGKIAPGTFKFILSLHFSEKFQTYHLPGGVGTIP